MRRAICIPNLGGARAVILHRPHPTATPQPTTVQVVILEDAECQRLARDANRHLLGPPA